MPNTVIDGISTSCSSARIAGVVATIAVAPQMLVPTASSVPSGRQVEQAREGGDGDEARDDANAHELYAPCAGACGVEHAHEKAREASTGSSLLWQKASPARTRAAA